jgi:hypothetical protein
MPPLKMPLTQPDGTVAIRACGAQAPCAIPRIFKPSDNGFLLADSICELLLRQVSAEGSHLSRKYTTRLRGDISIAVSLTAKFLRKACEPTGIDKLALSAHLVAPLFCDLGQPGMQGRSRSRLAYGMHTIKQRHRLSGSREYGHGFFSHASASRPRLVDISARPHYRREHISKCCRR